MRDAENIAARIANDEAAADEARQAYQADGLPAIEPDADAGAILQPGETALCGARERHAGRDGSDRRSRAATWRNAVPDLRAPVHTGDRIHRAAAGRHRGDGRRPGAAGPHSSARRLRPRPGGRPAAAPSRPARRSDRAPCGRGRPPSPRRRPRFRWPPDSGGPPALDSEPRACAGCSRHGSRPSAARCPGGSRSPGR